VAKRVSALRLGSPRMHRCCSRARGSVPRLGSIAAGRSVPDVDRITDTVWWPPPPAATERRLEESRLEVTFTPASASIGGALIGLASAILLLANGRIAGISGILGQALWPSPGESRIWRLAFLIGLPVGASLSGLWSGALTVQIAASPLALVAAGVLVGFGTRLGSGCTSGHGVCGISRGSPRSIAATATFMAVGGLCVFVVRHMLGVVT
jgi:hypothetical protein